jgi:glycosyltransferase involved in cell wall biosynthesis
MKPKVSWLLCTNRADNLLIRAVNSCLLQSYTDFELIIVANGPDAKLIADFIHQHFCNDYRICVLVSDVCLLNFNLSLGILKSQGDYIARMDADDISLPERLAVQVAYMDRYPDLIVLGSSYKLVDSHDQIHGVVYPPLTDLEIRKKLITGNPFCHPSVMLRRKAIVNIGAYLGGRNAEDYDLWCRLSIENRGKEIFANLLEPLIFYNVDMSGAARRSKEAYCNLIACQTRSFFLTWRLWWLIAIGISIYKLFFHSKRP